MMREEIRKLAAAIVRPSAEEEPLLDALCTAAEAEVSGRLQAERPAESCASAFCCAAALLAAAGVLSGRSGGNVEQFTAGDVSLRTGNGSSLCETAAALRRQAAALMAPYWRDDSFAFLGVRG